MPTQVRLDLQSLLEGLQAGVSVYFQPPENVAIQYPAIIYNRDLQQTFFADNSPYYRKTRWQITVIDRDPDSALPDLVSALPLSRFVRHFTTSGLNHDIYDVYF
jgi:hypothetical protein